MKTSAFNFNFWGFSTALSWTWGLGLFFAVQFTFQFGLTGLLAFTIPNAIGLLFFGVGAHIISKRNLASSNSVEQFFEKWSPRFSSVLLFYQIVAISITFFAISRYLFLALDILNPLMAVFLLIGALLAITLIFGEQFGISKIKYSHSFMFLILLGCAAMIWFSKPETFPVATGKVIETGELNFWSYLIPICIGFLTGPWLDLQQWQKVIQMQKEKTSILKSYIVGATAFFLILFFHGSLTLWALDQGAAIFAREGFDGIFYGQDIITRLVNSETYQSFSTLKWAYFAFLLICVITTLDSGYIAVKWFLKRNSTQNKNIIFSIVPDSVVSSPIPFFLLTAIIAIIALQFNLESEYFMVFYATYFVSYAMLLIMGTVQNKPITLVWNKVSFFAVSILSLVVAGLGYMYKQPVGLIAGSFLPLLYGIWIALKEKNTTEEVINGETSSSNNISKLAPPVNNFEMLAKPTAHIQVNDNMASEYVQDKWYVHTFRATYGDTNSVGNVYFGMYAMWVGKTRELFFNHCLPDFNLKNTPFLILTRSFEHKFGQEAKEFDVIKVQIKVKSFNRKFGVMEHRIYNQNDQLLGKGTQTLLFVSAKTYEQIDIPQEMLAAFVPFTA